MAGCFPSPRIWELRAGKGSAYEGGVRVPAIVVWPGVTKPGTECATPIVTMDWSTTITGQKSDGADLRPLLHGDAIAPRPIYWHYPHYHPGGATPYSAVREGDLRLVHFYEDDRVELFNLRDDPEEKRDLAASRPGEAKTLRTQLDAWRANVGAQAPAAPQRRTQRIRISTPPRTHAVGSNARL